MMVPPESRILGGKPNDCELTIHCNDIEQFQYSKQLISVRNRRPVEDYGKDVPKA